MTSLIDRRVLMTAGIAVGAALSGYAMHAIAEGTPVNQPLFYAGIVTSQGMPLESTHSVTVRMFAAEIGGQALCATPPLAVEFHDGNFRVDLLSADQTCRDVVAANADTWIELQVDTMVLPRSQVGAVPYALESAHAVSASSVVGQQAMDLAQLKTEVTALQRGTPAASAASYRFIQNGTGCYYDQPANATVCTCEPGEIILPAGCYAGQGNYINASRHQQGPDAPTATNVDRARRWILSCNTPSGDPVECVLVQALCLKI